MNIQYYTYRHQNMLLLTTIIISSIMYFCSEISAFCNRSTYTVLADNDIHNGNLILAKRFAQLAAYEKYLAGYSDPDQATISYQLAHKLLSMSESLEPDNEIYIQNLIDVAANLADQESLENGYSALLRINPNNSNAQLGVISAKLATFQNAKGRKNALETIINSPRTANLQESVRSQLAYQAAVLQLEMGNTLKSTQLLEQALILNPTNSDAILLSLQNIRNQLLLLQTSQQSPETLEDAQNKLIQLIKSDPVNPDVIMALVIMLTKAGSWSSARDLLDVVGLINYQKNLPVADDILVKLVLLNCYINGPQKAISILNNRKQAIIYAKRQAQYSEWLAQQNSDASQANNRTTSTINQPPDLSNVTAELPMSLEMLRLILASAADDDITVDTSLNLINNAWNTQLELIRKAESDDNNNSNSSSIVSDIYQLQIERLWLYLWINRNIEQVSALYQEIFSANPDTPNDNPVAECFRGWTQLRLNDPQAAAQILEPLSHADSRAIIGMALAYYSLGNKRESAGLLAELAYKYPDQITGAWAAAYFQLILGSPLPPTPQARKYNAAMGTFSRDLRELISKPDSYIALKLSTEQTIFTYLEPVNINIEISNDSPYTLAIGPDKYIDSTLALLPAVKIQGKYVGGNYPPIIINLQQYNYFIKPGQTITIKARVDISAFAWLLDTIPYNNIEVTYKAVLGYRDPISEYYYGSSCIRLIRKADPVAFFSQPITTMDIDQWLTRDYWTDNTSSSINAINQLAKLVINSSNSNTDISSSIPEKDAEILEYFNAHADQLFNSIIEAWPGMSDTLQAWLILNMPKSTDLNNKIPALSTLETIARRSTGKLFTISWLISRTESVTDPVLENALRSDDDYLQSFAELIKQRLILHKDAEIPSEDLIK